MNEIMKKTYELIDVLEGFAIIKELGMYKDRIRDNQELLDLIEKGNATDDEYLLLDIKRRLFKNKDYKGYSTRYNELMYLVMDINYRYSKLLGNGKGSCFK